MSEHAVVVENLVKEFVSLRAVDGLSFRVARGECFGILGPNGAGKTTTVRMINGYSPITSGALEVMGLDVRTQRRKVAAVTGVCQQDNNLDPDLSVLENLVVFARYFDIPAPVARQRAEELLEFITLTAKRDARVSELSGGMMRRLVMARALINEPLLLILDEPTTGLDPQSRHQLWDRVRELRDRGITVLLTTHYMDEAERLCDRLVIIDQGKLLVEGTPGGLIREYVGKQVIEVSEPSEELRAFIGEHKVDHEDLGHRLILYEADGDEAYHRIVDQFCTGGCMLRLPTLEDVFLRLTGRGLRE